MELIMPSIEISAKHKQVLADKYGVTRVAIQNALNYFSNSPNAQAIRQSAIILLQEEAAKASAVKIK